MDLLKQGWTLHDIDNSDYPFYVELLEHQAKKNDPIEQRKKSWEQAQVVPIDHVF
ncbi:hypothetical protein MOC27_22275 [Bacillus inaquosorum]|uniref:hypothetical protein n=1 Tax=Bacillus inaquosorum TaxID=483913 RepID=UPI002282AAE6|nr:hypothetical protein [Bacillus inaquosorum]MCY7891069.1 hypothetical protein [Bacillus spizizenii]MCY8054543.1 hypothetical protein [Bacillus inaquosorum]MCY8252386.1 hypothetical protein [Bacillus inaquosorum]MCY9409391.1 hypothetical protein [Bacillus inaquosorum]MCY9418563.1 hypothetical protein [Bacillus inaquosorum]